MMARVAMALAVVFLALTVAPGCQQVRRTLGIRTTIDSPAPGSPEALVRDVLAAALEKDESKGWKAYRDLLHSDQVASAASEKTWRTMNFPTLRRKVRLYLEDDTKPVYELSYREEVGQRSVKLFVFNEKSEIPTPCTMKPDAKRDGSWRITLCSL